MNWNYPTSIWFGEKRINEIQQACESLNIQKPLIVTDPGILKTNIIKIETEKNNISTQIKELSNSLNNVNNTNVVKKPFLNEIPQELTDNLKQMKKKT